MHKLLTLLKTTRTSFLILTPACVSVGVATAYRQTGRVNWFQAGLVLAGALSAHISVNVFNEYFDYKSGLDARTHRTPFSGGSGTLPAQPDLDRKTLLLAWLTLGITALIGLYFTWVRGWRLLPLGLLGLILLVSYTKWWVRQAVLSLVAPGLGFGILMVMGTYFALTGSYRWVAFLAALPPTFLVSDLLLLNQFPDVEADRSVGRKHYPILVGRKKSAVLYGLLLILTYLTIGLGVALGLFPLLSLISLLTAIAGWMAYRRARAYAGDVQKLVPALAMNVVVTVTTPVLLSLSLFFG